MSSWEEYEHILMSSCEKAAHILLPVLYAPDFTVRPSHKAVFSFLKEGSRQFILF